MSYSQTYLRNENGCYGFVCSCGFRYEETPSNLPFKMASISLRIDTALKDHDAKHKRGAANE